MNWLNNGLWVKEVCLVVVHPLLLIEYIIIPIISNTKIFENLSIARYNLAPGPGKLIFKDVLTKYGIYDKNNN